VKEGSTTATDTASNVSTRVEIARMAVNLISFNSNTTIHQENGELASPAKCLAPPANAAVSGTDTNCYNREVELDDDGDTLDVDERKMLKADWERSIWWSSAAQNRICRAFCARYQSIRRK